MYPYISRNYRTQTLDETPKAVKTLNGNVLGWNLINPNTVDVYVKMYDIAQGSVVVGTSTPKHVLQVPAQGSVLLEPQQDAIYHFDTAITIAAVTGLADSSTGALTTDMYAEIAYV